MRFLVALGFVYALTACNFQRSNGGNTSDAATDPDAPIDAATDAPPDMPPTPAACDPGACGAINGQCNTSDVCVVDENSDNMVVCPAGHSCAITCNNGACAAGVDCTLASACVVRCTEQDACRDGAVKCPLTGPCDVLCEGQNACQHQPVVCGNGVCKVQCLGQNACQDHGIDCLTSPDCRAECRGDNACQNGGIDCGNGKCTAVCDGQNACQNVDCNGTPSMCTYNCCEAQSCMNGPLCTGCVDSNTCD